MARAEPTPARAGVWARRWNGTMHSAASLLLLRGKRKEGREKRAGRNEAGKGKERAGAWCVVRMAEKEEYVRRGRDSAQIRRAALRERGALS